jgi:hypothetical protein
MSNRRRLARERLEIYLVYLLLMYRHHIWVSGVLLLGLTLAIMVTNSWAGFTILLPAIFLILLSNSYRVTLYTARLGAWIATLFRDED